MSTLGAERGSVQNPIIKYAIEIGWEYIKPENMLKYRDSEQFFLLKEIFINQINKLNPGFMDKQKIEDLTKRIQRIQANIIGNFEFWEYIKGLKTVYIPEENRERNVRLIDIENIDNNVFHVTDELKFSNGINSIRPDVVFFINGIPLICTETKAAHKVNGMMVALHQIRRYHSQCPELLVILQVYTLTHLIKFYYSGTWNTSKRFVFNWKEEVSGNYEQLIKAFFDKERVIKILTEYILFTREDDELKKIILRPHQIRAVDKIVQRAEDIDKRLGLIWHTQGSGKTYTMIVAAQRIIKNPIFENPTVIMLVDRNELESQLFGNLSAVGIEAIEVATSKRNIRALLSNDRRGLIITIIHKFDKMPEKINTRKNIFILIDEAHRTTGGKLGNYLMGALPNANYIGFTGTPIDKTAYGKGTFMTFGKDDPPHGYLDKYNIAESIADGTTVQLHYTHAPNELLVNKEILEREFLDLADLEGVSEIKELNKVLEKAVNLRNMLKNKKRIKDVAKNVKKHYEEFVEPLGYKAFLVAVDREACALYKEELDKLFPSNYTQVVFSPDYQDIELKKYHLSAEEEKRIRKDFRNPEKDPKILIVTSKLLTGFDAPILYCMYLDKPMRDHVLLQAIARVNRPYQDDSGRKKPSGLIYDFVGIFKNLEKALAFNTQDIEGVVNDVEKLKERFAELMEEARKSYLKLIEGKIQDKAVEAVLEHFKDEEKREQFFEFFKELQDIYDIISPDAFLRPYLEDFDTLLRMYKITKEAYEHTIDIDREFSKKVAKLVQEHTTSDKIKPSLEIYEINEDLLKKIEESQASDTEKVFNTLKSIDRKVKDEGLQAPYLISIGEKAERIAKLFKEHQSSTEDTLNELKKIIEEINRAHKEQLEKKMPMDIFSIFWLFKMEGFEIAEEMANEMQDVIKENPHWKKSESGVREIKQKLIKVILESGEKDIKKVTEITNKIVKILQEEKA